MCWIRIRNFCLDSDPEIGKFRAGSGSGINHPESTTLLQSVPYLAGNNANTIHYIGATGGVGAGDLMLMDAGTEYHGYTSDITRTWPVRGARYTDPQKM